MSKFLAWTLVAAAILSLSVSPTFAAKKNKGDKVEAAFKKLDANKDGSISLEEYKTAMEKQAEKAKEKKEKKNKN